MTRPTDEQLKQWLYDAEYDWTDDSDDHCLKPAPSDTFPHYYADDYQLTLAALFGELIKSRKLIARGIAAYDGDAVAQQLTCRAQDAEGRIAMARELHFAVDVRNRFDYGPPVCCAECGQGWPCDTAKVLDGEPS